MTNKNSRSQNILLAVCENKMGWRVNPLTSSPVSQGHWILRLGFPTLTPCFATIQFTNCLAIEMLAFAIGLVMAFLK
jgi:hypothetical protein